jgi:hypothetical protein
MTIKKLDRRVILTFIGSIDPDNAWTTIGDVMAVFNLATALKSRIEIVDVAWRGFLFNLQDHCVDLETISQNDYDAMVFVCGPIHAGFRHLFSRFSKIPRIAVGVSIPPDFDPWSLADAVLVRDSKTETSFDLALADVGYPHQQLPAGARRKGASVCLVGKQGEYKQLDGHGLAANLIETALQGWNTVSVQTLLDNRRPVPSSVELDLQSCSIMVTTRLHASLLSIFHGIPLIPVDQIRGGAKLTRILSKLGVQVLDAWGTEPAALRARAEQLISYPDLADLRSTRTQMIAEARTTLFNGVDVILETLS